MFNKLRNDSIRTVSIRSAVAALLLGGSGMATAQSVTVDLCATTGSTTGAAIAPALPVWGYALGTCSPLSAPGGPTIEVMAGDVVTVNLHNGLAAEKTGLLFQGQALTPDTTGAAAGGDASYTFTATRPGTYLYQAAPLPNAEHQVAMGLYGALVVRAPTLPVRTDASATTTTTSPIVGDPAASASDVGLKVTGTGIPPGATIVSVVPLTSFTMSVPATASGTVSIDLSKGTAYGGAATAFDDEAVLVLSEIDPALNTSATPAAFDMRTFAPKYFLINGKAYPDTAEISSTATHKLLLRYVNAGSKHHSMGTLGLRQNFIAKDGDPLPTAAVAVTAETLATGQTGDALISVPATAAGKFAVYDASLALHNSSAQDIGGMLTFVSAGPAAAATGPTASGVALAPPVSNGGAAVVLSATLTSSASTVSEAEYFIDTKGADGTGIAITSGVGSATAAVSSTVTTTQLGLLASGNHTFFVHGKDASGWGAHSFAVLNLDKTGPTTTLSSLTPDPSSGAVPVVLSATGDDSASGGSNVTAARYTLDGGPVVPMTPGGSLAPVRSLTATIAPPISSGSHAVTVQSQDALGNWGALVNTSFTVTGGGPTTNNVTAAPNPNNGTFPLSSGQPVLRVTATSTASGAGNKVVAAEGFVDSNPATTVRGFPFTSSDGAWNALTETSYVDIPLANISPLSSGNHTIYVRGKDGTGAWGATSPMTLVIDRTLPTANTVALSRLATNTSPVTITATGMDPPCAPATCGIGSGEFYIGAAGAAGSGTPMAATPVSSLTTISGTIPTATLQTLASGNRTVHVRVRDRAGNWSSGTSTATLIIDRTAPTIGTATLAPNTTNFGTAAGVTLNYAATDAGGAGLVAGAQYWIDGSSSNPPVNAVAFAGPSVTFTASAALSAGTHNVRVRVTDNAGNATVRSVPLYVVRAANNSYNTTIQNNAAGNSLVQAITVNQFSGVLGNDQPTGVAARTATPANPAVTKSPGGGAGSMTVALNANGSFTYTLTVPNTVTGAANIRAAKRGTYAFNYTETLNGVTSAATVTITIN